MESCRRSHRRCSIIKVVLKNLQNSQENTYVWSLCWSSMLACNFIKKRFQHSFFPVNIATFLRTPILKNICKRLLLNKNGDNKIFFQIKGLSQNTSNKVSARLFRYLFSFPIFLQNRFDNNC